MGRYLHFHISGKAEHLSMCLMVIFPKIIYFILCPFLLDPSFSYSFVGVLYSDYLCHKHFLQVYPLSFNFMAYRGFKL